MRLYAGFDLHSSNTYLGIVDEDGKRVFKKKLSNDRDVILSTLAPYKDNIAGIVVESTYNWYWLVDLLTEEGYKVHLANTTKIQKYSGLKYADDQHDAFWLAEMLRLGILPEGYIYPKEDRPVRDLLRKRSHLVRLRTSLILSLQNILSRNNGIKLNANAVKALTIDHVTPYLAANEDLALAGKVSKESIDFFTLQIKSLESVVEERIELREPYSKLLTKPGIGKILGLTIMLETGRLPKLEILYRTVERFRPPGSATRSKRAKGIGSAETSILPGHSPKQQSWRVDLIRTHEPITTARRRKRTGWWRIMLLLTNWRELPIISCGMGCRSCRKSALDEGWLGR